MFKKIAVTFFLVAFFFLIFCSGNSPLFYEFSDEFTVYSDLYSSKGETVNAFTYRFIFNKKGESVTVKDGASVRDILDYFNAKISFTEKGEDVFSVYAYSDKIKYFLVINGKKVNLHIAVGNKTTVGSPIIFGSF